MPFGWHATHVTYFAPSFVAVAPKTPGLSSATSSSPFFSAATTTESPLGSGSAGWNSADGKNAHASAPRRCTRVDSRCDSRSSSTETDARAPSVGTTCGASGDAPAADEIFSPGFSASDAGTSRSVDASSAARPSDAPADGSSTTSSSFRFGASGADDITSSVRGAAFWDLRLPTSLPTFHVPKKAALQSTFTRFFAGRSPRFRIHRVLLSNIHRVLLSNIRRVVLSKMGAEWSRGVLSDKS
eukprot:31366-Pelagococcus_subviridis.AAC.7